MATRAGAKRASEPPDWVSRRQETGTNTNSRRTGLEENQQSTATDENHIPAALAYWKKNWSRPALDQPRNSNEESTMMRPSTEVATPPQERAESRRRPSWGIIDAESTTAATNSAHRPIGSSLSYEMP